jgi:asparagine synthase (glutamine-hydrolysing)
MPRFIALVWDDRDFEAKRCALNKRTRVINAPGWATAMDCNGLAVFFHQAHREHQKPIPLHHQAGVILGILFKRATDAPNATERRSSIGERQTADILHSHGRSLIDSDWGSYVLFLRGPHEYTFTVFRGPCGSLACYYFTEDRCTIFVSDTSDLVWLCEGLLSLNWDSIRAQAAAGDYLTRETGLRELSAMISGESLDIREGKITTRLYWNPCRLTGKPIDCFAEAAALLQAETHRCIHSWASLHDTVLLLLSGGLDSSIVLSCLRSAPNRVRVIAVNFYSQGPGDERPYARSMAQTTGTQLEEVASNLCIDLREFSNCSLTPSPVLSFSAFDVEPVMRRLAETWNATVIFTGETGDDVFGHAPAPDTLAEILQHRQRMLRFFSASMDYAELARVSVWRAMLLAYRHLRWIRRIDTWSVYHHRRLAGQANDQSLVSRAACSTYESMISRFLHPWFQDTDALPLGKAMLIYSLVKATSSVSHSPFKEAADAPTLSPLVSQPLIEAALRIPSDMHIIRAENGAVARAAFRSTLSPLVLDRGVGKGIPATWARHLLENNTAFLSDLLLDGWLVQKGILERDKVQAMLSKDICRTRVGVADVIRQIYIETWLRRWIGEGARA